MSVAATKMLAHSDPFAGPDCFLSTTDRRGLPRADQDLRDVIEPQRRSRVAGGPQPQGVAVDPLRGLRAPEPPGSLVHNARLRDAELMDIWMRPSMAVTVQPMAALDAGSERAQVMGTVPRYLAAQVAVSDDVLPPGDPIIMSFVLTRRGNAVVAETPHFHFGERGDEGKTRAYAFAESRALNQALTALLAGAAPEAIAQTGVVTHAHQLLRDIVDFEDGAEPGPGAARLVHRAAWADRTHAEAIARALGPIYDCTIEPRLPSLIDEPRERPIAEALLAASLTAKHLDPALLYTVASEEGLGREASGWHRGISGLDIPRRIDGSRVFGLSSIADEVSALTRQGYLPSWFGEAVAIEHGRPDFVAAAGRTALTNGLTFVAARLAFARDQALAVAGRLLGPRADQLDQRIVTLLGLLHVEGGDAAVTRYLQTHTGGSMLPASAELRADEGLARAFARTAHWEQMRRTGVFEGSS